MQTREIYIVKGKADLQSNLKFNFSTLIQL